MGSRRLALAGGLLAALLAAAPASAHHRLTVNRALGASNTAAPTATPRAPGAAAR